MCYKNHLVIAKAVFQNVGARNWNRNFVHGVSQRIFSYVKNVDKLSERLDTSSEDHVKN